MCHTFIIEIYLKHLEMRKKHRDVQEYDKKTNSLGNEKEPIKKKSKIMRKRERVRLD